MTRTNILSISSSAGTITYTYDLISQLTKEVNGITGEIIDYTYDTGGNILSKTITKDGVSRTYNYGYNDTNWKDKLTSFDGQNILYDPIGNPLSLNGASLGWTQGRKLSTYTKDGTTAYYTYDENGIRKSKYVNGTTTEYLTSGGEVVAQKTGSNVTTYTRGADGSLISMNRNGTIYYYQNNLQGDVEQILDASGTAVVAYTYDAYGRITSTTGSLNDTLGVENPFRYRSCFFDQESGFYYLQSRYYDPVMGRFISADSQINPDVNGGNVFAYCSNNPVNAVDKTGYCYYDVNGVWRHDNWEYYSGYELKPEPSKQATPMPSINYVSQIQGADGFIDDWCGLDPNDGCAVASVVMALSSLGITMSQSEIIRRNGKSLDVVWLAMQDGVAARGSFSISDIDAALQLYLSDPAKYAPPIIRVKPLPDSHFAVVIGGADGNYITYDPWWGMNYPYTINGTDRIIQYNM